jgi:hypothetical protein
MQLSLNEEQTLLVKSFRKLFEDKSSIEQVRAAETKGHDPVLWRALAELGTFGMRLSGSDGFGRPDRSLKQSLQLASWPKSRLMSP